MIRRRVPACSKNRQIHKLLKIITKFEIFRAPWISARAVCRTRPDVQFSG